MGQAQEKQEIYTYEEYLALEQRYNIRYEYYQGEVFAMAGGTKRHDRISFNIRQSIEQIMHNDCDAFSGDVKIEIQPNIHYVYPDFAFSCDEADLEDDQDPLIKFPSLIVEVLSKSTRNYDKDQKKDTYMRLPSLLYYVLIDQHKYQIEVYERQKGFWKYTTYNQPEQIISFSQLNMQVTVKDIYRRVKFENS